MLWCDRPAFSDDMRAQTFERRQTNVSGGQSDSRLLSFGLLIRRAFDGALNLLYPPRCAGCGAVGEGDWCPRCHEVTHCFGPGEWLRVPPLTVDVPAGAHTILAMSAAPFIEPLRHGIHQFKYNGVPGLAEPFARLMVDAWAGASASAGLTVDLIVPVPLHAGRMRERGFNQSERLAFFVAQTIGVPMRPRALARIRHTEHQARLGAIERRRNVQGAFAADVSLCAGKRVLLVDDVLTTGTTLCECAAVLLAAGAVQVSALTLARASD